MTRRQVTPFVFPGEHGAYIVLIASWIWGILFSPTTDALGSILVFATAFPLFLLQESLRRTLLRPSRNLHPAVLALFSIAVAAATVLVLKTPPILVLSIPALVISGIYFHYARKGAGPFARSAIGFILLSLVTPATIMASGSIDYPYLLFCWLSVACFSISSVLTVGIRLRQEDAQRYAMIFHIVYVLAAVACILAGLPLFVAAMASVAFVRHVLVLTAQSRYTALPLKHIGIMESIVTILALIASAFLV